MEYRKVQKTGGSSYIITLPINWIKSLGIREKHRLAIITQPDGRLLISADMENNTVKHEKKINIDGIENSDYLFRLLLGTYIMGFDSIHIVSKSKINSKFRKVLSEFIRTVIGFEIFEESSETVTIKTILNPSEMPFSKSIKRINIVAHSMHEDVILALLNSDTELAEDVLTRDIEINRRYRLIARQSNMILRDVVLAQKMKVTLEDAHHYFLISKQLERVGDHAKSLAKNILILIEKDLSKEIKDLIELASKASMDALKKSLYAWEQKDIELANETIELIPTIREHCDRIAIFNEANKVNFAAPLGYIIEGIYRTGEHAANIAEIVFDNLLQE